MPTVQDRRYPFNGGLYLADDRGEACVLGEAEGDITVPGLWVRAVSGVPGGKPSEPEWMGEVTPVVEGPSA